MRVYIAFLFSLTTASIIAADVLNLSNQLLEIQDDVITITKAISNKEKLDSVKSKFNATHEAFEVLSSDFAELSSSTDECDESVIAMLGNHIDAIKVQMKDLETRYQQFEPQQLVRESIEDIKALRFASVQEKLEGQKSLPLVARVVQDLNSNLTESFDLLTNLTENLTSPELVYFFVKALQEEIAINDTTGGGDPDKWMRLAKIIEAGVVNKPDVNPDIKSSAQGVLEELYQLIRVFTLNALEKSTGKFEKYSHLDNLTAAVYIFDPAYSESIIEEIVRTSLEKKYLNDIFDAIESHRFIQQRIKGLSELFWAIKGAHKIIFNDDVILNMASALYKIHSDSEFRTLSPAVRLGVKNVIDSLPACVRNLFFLPSVCLWNKANEQYLTVGNSTFQNDGVRRNVFTTEDSLPGSHWKVERIGEQFLFSSRAYPNEYLYAAEMRYNPNLRYLFSWIPGNNTDRQSTWNILLWYGDYCFIRSAAHYENIISTGYRKTEGQDKDLSYAFVWVPRSSFGGNQFQWQIRECD